MIIMIISRTVLLPNFPFLFFQEHYSDWMIILINSRTVLLRRIFHFLTIFQGIYFGRAYWSCGTQFSYAEFFGNFSRNINWTILLSTHSVHYVQERKIFPFFSTPRVPTYLVYLPELLSIAHCPNFRIFWGMYCDNSCSWAIEGKPSN
jgi:hypothetical protein